MATIKSIEEKAKAYDEALERAKHSDGIYPSAKELKEYIFPELRESEDERFKEELKEVLDECLNVRPQIVEEKQYMRLIAWLEKQGEHANFRNKIQIGDKVIRNEDGVLVNLSQLKRVAKKDEKQGEQRSSWCEEDEINLEKAIWYVGNPAPMVVKDSMLVEWLKSLKERVQPQQKPTEWSEEDETIAKALTKAANDNVLYGYISKSKLLEWFKNLKGRVQPKQEWSEEDEKRLNTIIGFMNSNPAQNPFYDKSCLERWLRSLRPQPHWKPSDEQIETLEKVIGYSAFPDAKYCVELKRLLEQLKAL